MARDNPKTPTPAPEAALAKENQAPAKKKFSFSFDFFRKNDNSKAFGKSNKEFADKVAPSRRELEAQAAKRRAQRAKTQGGIKPQPTPEPESEKTEKQLQPV